MPGSDTDQTRIYRFGVFELNPHTRQLLHEGRRVAIQLKPFELLVYLIRHRERVVPRDELMEEIWRGVHVDEPAVRFTLHGARKAVRDDGNRQDVIQTIPGVGFRFVAPVEELGRDAALESARPAELRSAEGAHSPFLGRGRLLAEAGTLLDDTARGQGRVLLLNGEAGIGKTRALEQLAGLAEARGFRVLRGRCVESEGAPAFWPWIQILRGAVAADVPRTMLCALGESAPEVAWMVPELRPFVPDVPQMGSLDAQAARFMLFDGVANFLRGLTDDRPHLLCLDDLHRADTASLALLLHLARELARTRPSRLALVGSYRDMELRATPALADLMVAASASSEVQTEALRGLELDDLGALVENLTGTVPSAAVVAELHQTTNGNPFFLHQILQVLETEKRLPELESDRVLGLELPRHVQDAICRRVRLLPAPVRELIEFASVVGREFTLSDLEAATQLERIDLLARLGPAIDAGVVGEAEEIGRYRFVHVLVGDAIYARLPLELRAGNHARIARVIASRCGDEPSPDSASLAHHYVHSSTPGDSERAIGAYEMAARWCSARGAFENAPEYLDRALALLTDSGTPAEADRCRLLVHLGAALTNAGSRDRARECLQTAAEIAQQRGLREELAAAALHFAPDFLAIETGVYDPQLVGLLESAIASLGEAPTPLRAKLLARLGIAIQWNLTDEARSRALCDEADAIAAQGEDPEATQYVKLARSLIHFSLVDPQRQLTRTPALRRTNASLDLLERLLRITSLLLMGRIQETDAEIAVFAEIAEDSRHPQARWYVDLMRSTRALMEGRYEEAARLAVRYLALGARFGDRNAIQSFGVQSIMSSFDVGKVEIHEDPLRGLVATFPGMAGWRAGLILFLTETGRYEEARSELQRLVASRGIEAARTNEWYAVYAALALASSYLESPDLVAKMYATLIPYAPGMTVVGYCSYSLGSTQRLLAVLASTLRRWDSARHHFEAAIATNTAVGAIACNGRVCLEYARMLLGAGDRAASIVAGEKGLGIASRFGMQRLAGLINVHLAGIDAHL